MIWRQGLTVLLLLVCLVRGMAPTLPHSLSPHICILSAPDLSELLDKASLPPLQNILQSFSPLPQGTFPMPVIVVVHKKLNFF